MGGHWGKLLLVDLSRRRWLTQPLEGMMLREYLGGSGLAARLLFGDGQEPPPEPLGPENTIVFMTGPCTGTRVPNSGRHQVAARSPLTGIYGESDVGGRWGTALKRCGYDGIVVSGCAEFPVYLYVTPAGVELRDARDLWGLDTFCTDAALQQETTDGVVTSVIGPAGERCIPLAAIMSDGPDARAAGRCGLGAVMGSKKLKAIAVAGNRSIPVEDESAISSISRSIMSQLRQRTKVLHDLGTAGSLQAAEYVGDLPVKNWSLREWKEGAEAICGERIREKFLTGRFYCGACVIGCGRKVRIQDGRFRSIETAGPEYETLGSLGANCLVKDLEAIVFANELCNRYGLDTISVGGAVAFAMEAFEHGLLTERDTGYPVRWGDAKAMIHLISDIAHGRGVGQLLGQGVRRAGVVLGPTARYFAIHVKGLEFPMHDPRAYHSLAVAYATSNRGACHLQGFSHIFERNIVMPELGVQEPFKPGWERKGMLVAKAQDLMCVMDSLKMCKFSLFGGVRVSHLVGWLNAVTGWDMELNELLQIGERIYNLKRLYNLRLGETLEKDDVFPERIASRGTCEEGQVGRQGKPLLRPMLQEYYAYRGWSQDGVPSPAKLEALRLPPVSPVVKGHTPIGVVL